nr:uncharacterized protein LOC115262829 [Aedes albopictus]
MLPSVQSNIALVKFLRQIILSYFASENYCTVIYYDQYQLDSQKECDQHCEFMLAIEVALVQMDVEHAVMWITSSESSDDILESAIENGCQSYIVATNDVIKFLEMKLMIKETTVQRIRDKNFLFFVDDVYLNGDEWIIREAMKFYPNLWFAMPSGNDKLEFYSQDYSITNTTKLQLVQSYNITAGDEVVNGTIFYDKLFDLGGRTIPMAVAEYVPYCITTECWRPQWQC